MNQGRYQFTEKKPSKLGLFAFIAGLVLFFAFIFLLIIAYRADGMLPAYFGTVGLSALLLTLADFLLAVSIMRDERFFVFYPRLAAIVSGATLICWIGIYVMGFIV